MSEYTPRREVIEEEFYRHQPVLSMKDGSIAGCQCMDRVFYRKTEDWGSHLADVHQSLLAAHDAEVQAQALVVTDEMLLRAAVALWSQAAKGTLQPNYPWDGITAELREQFRVHARAALEAAFRENGSSDS